MINVLIGIIDLITYIVRENLDYDVTIVKLLLFTDL